MDQLATYAATQPDKVAVIDDRPGAAVVRWSFADLDRRANQLARHLLSLGVDASTKVVWCGQNSAPLVVVVHALRRIGAVSVPLNYRLTAEEAAYVVDNCDARIVYVDAVYADLIAQAVTRAPKVTDVLVFAGDGEGPLEQRLAAYPSDGLDAETEAGPAGASMVYTSGTTGKPKGAVRSATVDPSYVAGLVATIGFVPEDVYITTGPLYHSGPGGFANVAQALGNTVVLQHRFDPEDWLRLVDAYRVTTTFTAPTPIRMVCGLPAAVKARYDRSSMQRLIANAAPWSLALKQRYMADFSPASLWEVYGSTELGVDTVLGPEDHLRKPASCGKPAPGVEIKLFAEDGREITGAFEMGELYVRSGGMFRTYYKAEEKYRAGARGEFHTVGDIAYRDDEGYYYIADRKDDMIISGGMNVYPAEVEAALDASPDVFEVAVFGVPSEAWGEAVHAAVVPARPGVTEEEITAFARQHLAGYKVPRSYSFVAALPKTGSGKVLKRQLRAPFWPAPPAASPSDGRLAGG